MNIGSETQTPSAAMENTCIVVTLNQEKKNSLYLDKVCKHHTKCFLKVQNVSLKIYWNILLKNEHKHQ